MAHRSDRRGARADNKSGLPKSRPVDWLPTREFPSWPGQRTAHLRAEDTTAVDLLRPRLSCRTLRSPDRTCYTRIVDGPSETDSSGVRANDLKGRHAQLMAESIRRRNVVEASARRHLSAIRAPNRFANRHLTPGLQRLPSREGRRRAPPARRKRRRLLSSRRR